MSCNLSCIIIACVAGIIGEGEGSNESALIFSCLRRSPSPITPVTPASIIIISSFPVLKLVIASQDLNTDHLGISNRNSFLLDRVCSNLLLSSWNNFFVSLMHQSFPAVLTRYTVAPPPPPPLLTNYDRTEKVEFPVKISIDSICISTVGLEILALASVHVHLFTVVTKNYVAYCCWLSTRKTFLLNFLSCILLVI